MTQVNKMIGLIRQYGIAKTNRFQVLLNPPAKLGFGNQSQRLSLVCEMAEIPGKAIATSDVRTHGPLRKNPYLTTYSPLDMTFRCGKDMLERDMFEAWVNLVCDPQTHLFGFYDDYVEEITINQLSGNTDQLQIPYACKLFEAFPINVGELRLNQAEENAYHQLRVTMAYRNYIRL